MKRISARLNKGVQEREGKDRDVGIAMVDKADCCHRCFPRPSVIEIQRVCMKKDQNSRIGFFGVYVFSQL